MSDWHGLTFNDIDPRLCTLCGTCISICPVHALSWQDEQIAFDSATCTACGLCYAVCPVANPKGAALPAPADPFIGPYHSLYQAHATDPTVRKAGSAGGAVTALLLTAMRQGIVDGAVVVTTDPRAPTRPRVTVAYTEAEVRESAQSKYCLAPVNAVLGQTRQGNKRLAIVALPCQAHGIRLAQALNLAVTHNVALVIGLFCGFQTYYSGTVYLLHKLHMEPDEVKKLEYRGGPWPGGFRAVTYDGRRGFIPKHQYTYVHLMYAPEGCHFCPDLTAEFADLSVGDFWADESPNNSLLIGRTETGRELIRQAVEKGHITAQPITYDEVWASHRHLLLYKKKGAQVRRKLARRRPVEGYPMPPLEAGDWPGHAAFYGLMRFSSGRLGRWIIRQMPLSLSGWLSETGRRKLKQRRHTI